MANENGFLVLDTESSGLFRFKDEAGNPVPADAPGQPRLASISLLRVTHGLDLEGEYTALVRPDGWEMSPGATEVNGLTTELLLAKGRPVVEVLEQYRDAILRERRTVVAHNAQHDLKQMRAELRRAGMPDLFDEAKNICTMRTLMGIVKKPGGKGGWPKLADCCAHFGLPLKGDHSATGDAHAVFGLMRHMRDLDLLREGEVHYAKRGAMKKRAKAAALAEGDDF